jgi:flavin reductase (DIM6/NTAB) family NADH-FMN oxidoreductase RutF
MAQRLWRGDFMTDKENDRFVVSPMRDNWYQASSYYASSFSLITTVNEAGVTSIGPYQLSFPFEVINRRSWMVISRPGSNTANNVLRTKKCTLHFVEHDEAMIKTILNFGYPGQEPEEKMKDNDCFTLIESPTPGRESSDIYPKIIQEAYQAYECTLDVDRINENPILRDSPSAHLLLNIDNILVKESWKKNVDGSGDSMPRAALTYGFRGANTFWFGAPEPAYKLPIPDKGPKDDVVHYVANRLDDEVRFTKDACKQLTGIPKAFLEQALKGIVAEAKKRDVVEVDLEFVQMLNAERDG